ncbi:GAF domain-containing protein [Natronobeatus ordinarius]|uniref:GAF domain-containing protein n=1 Tax=Natronobeatus ordinarius TaxID=2963433 RepID=UPI0020CE6BF6|nr:GAF domain-containing protein [Natronobeatus ordinarius]
MIDTVLYVAASNAAADDGAAELERAGSSLAVEPAVDMEKIHGYARSVDCVVFAETPTTPEGAHLLEVLEACGSTPVVLYTDAAFGPAVARSTDGVEGYVRREGDASVSHLADEIAWVCSAPDRPPSAEPAIDQLHELASRLRNCRDEDAVLEAAIETAGEVVEADAWVAFLCESREDGDWLVPAVVSTEASTDDVRDRRTDEGVTGRAFREGQAYRVDDADEMVVGEREPYQSVIAVPIAEFGVFLAVAERSDAFGEADLTFAERLGTHVFTALYRLRLEEQLRNRHRDATRLEEDVAELEETVTDLEEDVARLATARARLETAFDAVPAPVVRYEVVDGTAVVSEGNERFEEVFCDERATNGGTPLEDVLAPPAGAGEATDLNDRLLAGESQRVVARQSAGTESRPFVVHSVPLADGSRGVAICTDVTEQDRLEEELADRDDRLEELAEFVNEELRPPLNVARAYLEIVTETDDPEHYAEIEDAHERLCELLDDVQVLASDENADDDAKRAEEFVFGV